MFPSKFPLLYAFKIVGIIACVIICLIVLQNPLALFALLMLPEVPILQMQDPNEAEDEDNPNDYQTQSIGFTGQG